MLLSKCHVAHCATFKLVSHVELYLVDLDVVTDLLDSNHLILSRYVEL